MAYYHQRLKLSKPYINKKLKCFERTVSNPRDVGSFSAYTPLVFDSTHDTWLGQYITSGDDPGSSTRYRSVEIKDKKFGDWYRKEGYKLIEQLRAERRWYS